MATQDSHNILFTHTQPQQGFRLLELPPDLEELLSSKDAPVYVPPFFLVVLVEGYSPPSLL